MARTSALPLLLAGACLPSSPFDIHETFPTDTGSSSTDDTAGSSSSSSTDGDSSSTSGGEGGSGSSGTTGHSDSSAMTSGAASSTTSTGTTGGEPVCGNGVVEAPEECDGGERCFECTRDRWIFVTSATHLVGDFPGVPGADGRCRQYAQKGGATDTWTTFIAWISDTEQDMTERLPHTIRGRYVRTDGVVVAESVDELFSGMLAAPIDVDEFGQEVGGGGVLTGTLPDGTAAPGTLCEDWTTKSHLDESAYVGESGATDEKWTMHSGPYGCALAGSRLYCLEAK